MSSLAEELDHLKNHVSYPADRNQLVSACNNVSDAPTGDRDWFSKTLPEGTYRNTEEVLSALIERV